jgi:hypothetical protein
LFLDVSLVVFKINHGICLLHCKDCNVCLGANPCQVHTHILKHINQSVYKCLHNDKQSINKPIVGVPSTKDLTSSFKEIQFTLVQNHSLKKYIVTPLQQFFQVIFGIIIFNRYQCKVNKCISYCALKSNISKHHLVHHYQVSINNVTNLAMCKDFFERLATWHCLVLITRTWILKLFKLNWTLKTCANITWRPLMPITHTVSLASAGNRSHHSTIYTHKSHQSNICVPYTL